jgi:hypothetical protein
MLSTIGLMEPTSCGGPLDILDAPCGAAALEDDALEDRRGTAVRRALFLEMLIAGPLIDPASSLPSSSSSSSLLRPAGAVVRLERRTFSAPATSRGLPAPRAPAQCVLCVLCFFYFSPLVKMPYLHFIREGSLIFFRSSGFI